MRNVVINPIQEINENDLPILGRLFFTSAYLSVNHDTETFSLWQAARSSREPILRALDDRNAPISDFCLEYKDETPAKPKPTQSIPESAADKEAEKKGLSTAVLGGIIAGGVAGCAIMIAAAVT